MATVIVDFTAFPQTVTVNGTQLTALNDGKWRATYTPTLSSASLATGGNFYALSACNDLGGLWMYDDGGTLKVALFEDASGSPLIVEHAIARVAGSSFTVVIDNVADTMTLSGTLTSGAGTYAFTGSATGNAFGTSPIGGGAYGGGGFSWAGSMSDIDDGNDGISGTGSPAVGAVTSAGTGALPLAATGTPTIAAVTSAGAGAVALAGAGTAAVPAVTSAGAGALAVAGTGSLTVDAVTSSGSGTLDSTGIAGTGSPAVPDVTSAGTGTVAISGAGSPTVPAVASTGAGAVAIAGTGTPTIDPVTLVATDAAAVEFGVYDAQRVLYGSAAGTVTTESLTTTNGSTFIICTGGNLGDLADAPTDSKGNTYTQLGAAEEFDRWAGYGLALWICVDGVGGSGHTASQEYGQTLGFDEMTIAFAEVKNGHHVQGYTIAQALTGAALTFTPITTAAAAILPAFFCGDAPTGATTTLSLSNGYTVVDTDTLPDHPNGYVPIAIAYADKPTAGSHGTTATETPDQGAIMIQVALQVAEFIGGTGTITIPAVTSSGAGTLPLAATGTPTIAAVTGTGAGTVALAATGAASVGSVGAAGSGAVALAGTGSAALGAVTSAGAGTAPIAGTGSPTVDAITAAGTGTAPLAGTGGGTIGAVTGEGVGAVGLAGTGAASVGDVTSTGSGDIEGFIAGTGSVTIDSVTSAGSGALSIAGAGAAQVPAVSSSGAGSVAIAGTGSPTVPAITSVGAGSGSRVPIPAGQIVCAWTTAAVAATWSS